MIKKNIAIILLILNTVSLCAQDKIVSLGKDTIRCFIHEIGDTEIKYSMEGYRADLLFGIDKNKIKDVIFADGRTLHFKDSMHDPSYYENQRKNALKINFLSPLFGSTGFSFERSLGVARSIEGDLGIIGLGFNNIYNNPKGIYLKCGYKFIKGPDYYLKGMHYAHILKGAYIKPEIAFSSYYYTQEDNANSTVHNTLFAFLIDFGKQWVFDDRFLVDIFCGLGYGFGNSNNQDYFHFAFSGPANDTHFAFTSGLMIGILIK